MANKIFLSALPIMFALHSAIVQASETQINHTNIVSQTRSELQQQLAHDIQQNARVALSNTSAAASLASYGQDAAELTAQQAPQMPEAARWRFIPCNG